MTILDIILLRYPGLEGVTYWNTQYDGTPWKHPYEGLKWENTEVPKPSKEDISGWEIEFASKWEFEQNKRNNQPIYDQLNKLDLNSIRALRTKDESRLADIEQQAEALRAQLLPVS